MGIVGKIPARLAVVSIFYAPCVVHSSDCQSQVRARRELFSCGLAGRGLAWRGEAWGPMARFIFFYWRLANVQSIV